MIELFNIDCMDKMKEYPDKWFDLAIVDPPYGIHENGNRDLVPKGAACARKKYNDALWLQDAPTDEYFSELFRVSQNQIIWGGNYFNLGPTRCYVFWDKRGTCPGNDFADGELGWTSFNTSLRKFTHLWNGMLQEDMSNKESRIHPTQKPVKLYEWLLKNYAKPGDKILDTHRGSMSSAIACYNLDYDLVLMEIDKDYFESGKARLEEHKKQGRLFNVHP